MIRGTSGHRLIWIACSPGACRTRPPRVWARPSTGASAGSARRRTGERADGDDAQLPGMGEWLSEESIHAFVAYLVRFVEIGAALVIFVGVVVGLLRFASEEVRGHGAWSFQPIRLTVGRFLALGLELQLGADLLRTAVSPTWQQIGQLAAIAAIRTALNFFLQREIAEEETRDRGEPPPPRRARLLDKRSSATSEPRGHDA